MPFTLVLLSRQMEAVRDAVGKFFLIMRDKDECLVRTKAELLDNLTDKASVAVVETVKGFVEDEQFGVFDEGTGQKAEPLLAAAQLQERAVGKFFYAEDTHPVETCLPLFWTRSDIKSHRIV